MLTVSNFPLTDSLSLNDESVVPTSRVTQQPRTIYSSSVPISVPSWRDVTTRHGSIEEDEEDEDHVSYFAYKICIKIRNILVFHSLFWSAYWQISAHFTRIFYPSETYKSGEKMDLC